FFAGLAVGGGGASATAPAEEVSGAQRLLADNISNDVHTHGGATGVISAGAPNDDLSHGMRAGHVAIVCLADVPDQPVIRRDENNVLRAVRRPELGELYQFHLDRLAWMDELVARHGIRRALTVGDLRAAHAAGQPAIIVDIEALDFLEGNLEGVEES